MLDVFSSVCQAVSGHWVYRLHCREEVWSVSVPSWLQQHSLDSHGGTPGRQQCSHLWFMSYHRYHNPTGDSLHWPLPSLAEWHAAGRGCPCSSGCFGGFAVILGQFGPFCRPRDWHWPHVTNEPLFFFWLTPGLAWWHLTGGHWCWWRQDLVLAYKIAVSTSCGR